jgi:uncharacterized protein (DUF885 family)
LPYSVDKLFDDLQHEYYHAWLRFHPETAVDVCVPAYAGHLKTYDDDDIGALVALDQKLLSALDELDHTELDENRRVDFNILCCAADIELHSLQESDWRYRNPLAFVPVRAVYQLLIHPVTDVQKAIKHRLQHIPEYLRGARSLLSQASDRVAPVWLDSAISECHAGSAFIRNLGRHPLITEKFTNPARLQPLYDGAAHALDEFACYLERDVSPHASGDFAVGVTGFNRLLNEKHFLEIEADAVLAFGERLFERTDRELRQLAMAMQGNDDIEALLQKIHDHRPDSVQLLDAYRKRIRDVHHWLIDKDIVTIPSSQSLHIQQTPKFLQPLIPFAAYEPPMACKTDQQGLYYVTTSGDGEQQGEHNSFSIDLTCIHEAFPGHHLQFVTANQHQGNNITRSVHTSASMYEGWALYCEHMVLEQGFLDSDEHRFIMLRDILWRALRVIIDVKIHTAGMSVADAVALLVDRLGLAPSKAEAELAWYTNAPATPLCYAVGYELIIAVREFEQRKAGFSLKSFHDALLAQGSIALPLVIKQAFGEDAWRYARARLDSI